MKLLIAMYAVAVFATVPLAHAGPVGPGDVPTPVRVEDGHKVFLVGHAVGVQIYRCDGSRWEFVAPRADLYDDHGNRLTTHYGGPTWEARDGSTVTAARVDGVTVDPAAIPWLKLKADDQTAGRLYETTFIQRVNTTGGLIPPATTCNAETDDAVEEVPYTADYYFWKRKAG